MVDTRRQIVQRHVAVPARPLTDRDLLLDALLTLSGDLSAWPLQNLDCYPRTELMLRIAEHIGFPVDEIHRLCGEEGHGARARQFIKVWVHDNR